MCTARAHATPERTPVHPSPVVRQSIHPSVHPSIRPPIHPSVQALLLYAIAIEALPRSEDAPLVHRPLHGASAALPSPPTALPAAVAAAAGSRVISLPEDMRDGCYGLDCGTAGGEGGQGGGDAALLDAVRAARLQWLRVQEAYAQAEEAALAQTHAALRRDAGRHGGGGGGSALLRVSERRRQVASPPHPRPHPRPRRHPSPPTRWHTSARRSATKRRR